MNLESFPWLSSIVLLPLIGALIMPFLSSKEGEDNSLPRNISLSFLFIDFLLIIGVLFQKFNTSDSSLQLVERASWLPSIGLEWSLGVDGLSAPLVALSGLITFLSAAASWKIKKKSIFCSFTSPSISTGTSFPFSRFPIIFLGMGT